jgi:hypothetical protein
MQISGELRQTPDWVRSRAGGCIAALMVFGAGLLAACAPQLAATTAPQPLPTTTATMGTAAAGPRATSMAAQESDYQVLAWLLNDRPRLGETVTLIATLTKDGMLSGGEWMKVTWPDKDAPAGIHLYRDTPSYGRGICYIRVTEQYPPGQPVPVTIGLLRQGTWYEGEVSFTPQ